MRGMAKQTQNNGQPWIGGAGAIGRCEPLQNTGQPASPYTPPTNPYPRGGTIPVAGVPKGKVSGGKAY